jgi:indolepyruvate ferredoxin oxidoreductase beta subunit
MSEARPVKLLIAAMGGEGGGVLMDWIVSACWRLNYPVQATSVPGVAQRTGATTYYIEILPEARKPEDKRPIFALVPTAGEVDLMVATELAEAARAVSMGFVTKARTTLIAATHRVYTTDEKIVMGDGRLDAAKLKDVVEAGAKQAILFDAAEAARRAQTVINAVMLGAIAQTGILRIDQQEFISAIEEEGKAVRSNLAGFRAGFAIAKGDAANPTAPDLTAYPTEAREVIEIGIARLTDYQNEAYAKLYQARLEPFRSGDPILLREVARHLAVRMSYEDIIRVAQAKIRAKRFARIKGEARADDRDILQVTEFFKPGYQEVADLLPPSLGKRLIGWAERSGRLTKSGWAMHVRSTTVTGFLKIWLLAKLKGWRPRSYRFAEETRAIEAWLGIVEGAARRDPHLALEVAELARLIKGYGSTHRRGLANYDRIVGALVMPALARSTIVPKAAERVARAREAALKDPDGKALSQALAFGPDVAEVVVRAAE